jgi:hypothetical protein
VSRRIEGVGTIRTEGGLLSRDLLDRVAVGDKTLVGMAPDAYHLAPNEKLGEAITRSWNRLVGAWEAFSEVVANLPPDERTATTITRQRWSLLLFQELGFGQLQTAKAIEVGDKRYPVSHGWDRVPIHVVGARVDLDHRTPGVAGAATMSPHSLVQELLNRTDEHLWAIVTNGLRLRLLRDNVALTRQAYVEFDLEAMLTGQAYADFALLWLVCHQSRFEADIPAKCLLEQWTLEANERGTRALDQLRIGVEAAITALGEGFLAHSANIELRRRLDHAELDKQDYYRQLLRTVYRLLFLFVAENRDLLLDPHADETAKQRYRSYYSLSRLRLLADARRGTTHGDQWAGLGLVMRVLGEEGEPALALPGLGSFLWKTHATPDLDTARLDNRHLLAAIRSLSTTTEGGVTRSVDYRNLGAEELGSIYESLLELHPVLDLAARTFSLATAGGNERKTTGSYYTPTSLITELLDSTLEPVLDAAATADDPEAALLAVTVLDPACGSGHFLIAAAHRIAKRLAAVRSGDGEPAPPLVQEALREVVARCIHGIDVNEMAVELCKVSLWMEAMVPGKPLAFLDHRIVCGNSLLGTTPDLLAKGVPDEAFKARTGDDKVVVASLKKRNKAQRAGQDTLAFGRTPGQQQAIEGRYLAIDEVPGDDVAGIATKERSWLKLQRSEELSRAELAADAWCTAFVVPKTIGAAEITTAFVRQAAERPASALDAATVEVVSRVRQQYHFFHLYLAFPHVFGGSAHGGFDVVLGNPPWEQVEISEEASSSEACKVTGVQAFVSLSGRFPLTGSGRRNLYGLFAELSLGAVNRSGRCGLVMPTGLVTDQPTEKFCRYVVRNRRIVSFFDFENQGRFFASVHRQQRFGLLTLSGAEFELPPSYAFSLEDPFESHNPEVTWTLSWEAISAMSPVRFSIPTFRDSRDAEIAAKAYRVGDLIHSLAQEGRLSAALLFNFDERSRQSKVLSADTEGASTYVQVYEGSYFHSYDHRFGSWSRTEVQNEADSKKEDPSYHITTEFVMAKDDAEARWREVSPTFEWYVGLRRQARTTDGYTSIAAILPASVSEGSVTALFGCSARDAAFICAVFNAFAFNFLVRLRQSGANLNRGILMQMPVPAVLAQQMHGVDDCISKSFVVERAIELSYTATDVRGFAQAAGCSTEPFRWEAPRRAIVRVGIEAAMFHLYGLDRADVAHVMDVFSVVRRKDEAAFGEYRTKSRILEVFDAMATASESGEPYRTILDPSPADPSLCHPASISPDLARRAT